MRTRISAVTSSAGLVQACAGTGRVSSCAARSALALELPLADPMLEGGLHNGVTQDRPEGTAYEKLG